MATEEAGFTHTNEIRANVEASHELPNGFTFVSPPGPLINAEQQCRRTGHAAGPSDHKNATRTEGLQRPGLGDTERSTLLHRPLPMGELD